MTKDEVLKLALEALEKLTNAAEGFSVSGVYFNEELWARKCLDDAYDAMGFAQEALAQPEQRSVSEHLEPVATLDDLEQEIYENTRQFVSRDVMEWMLKRYYTTPPQPKQKHQWCRGECVKCGMSIEKQKPAAWVSEIEEEAELMLEKPKFSAVALYTSSPTQQSCSQRTWVRLTDNEIALINADYPHPHGFARAIEAKLKEKNT